jgi:hypothetical protein
MSLDERCRLTKTELGKLTANITGFLDRSVSCLSRFCGPGFQLLSKLKSFLVMRPTSWLASAWRPCEAAPPDPYRFHSVRLHQFVILPFQIEVFEPLAQRKAELQLLEYPDLFTPIIFMASRVGS